MSDIIRSFAINQPDGSNSVSDDISPTIQRVKIEEKYLRLLSQADERMNTAKDEFESKQDSRTLLIESKVSEYLSNPSARHGFTVEKIFPHNQNQVIQNMASQGYSLYRLGTGLAFFIRMPKSAKDNPLDEIRDKARIEAEATIDNVIARAKVKLEKTIHERNIIVKQAKAELAAIKSFEDHLNIIVTEEVE